MLLLYCIEIIIVNVVAVVVVAAAAAAAAADDDDTENSNVPMFESLYFGLLATAERGRYAKQR